MDSPLRYRPKKKKKEPRERRTLEKDDTNTGTSFLGSWMEYVCQEVDISSLVAFRIMWGLIMCFECYRFGVNNYAKLDHYYVEPEFFGEYYGFHWIFRMTRSQLHIFLKCMMASSIGIATGTLYPISCLFFALSWSYLILLDSIIYLNHFYLIAIFAYVLILLPANRSVSVDVLIFPSIYKSTMPRYNLLVLQLEQVIVYFYAGVAKCNEDWLRASPVKFWLAADYYKVSATVGPDIARILSCELMAYVICYAGLIFDTFIGFFLMFSNGIVWYTSMISCIFFHCMNKILFSIGIFPQVMLISTTIFFTPTWARKYLPFLFSEKLIQNNVRKKKTSIRIIDKIIIILIILFLLHQILLPLRHHMYSGNVAWNEKGHKWSWRMKLRDKICHGDMIGVDENNSKYLLDIKTYLWGKQYRKVLSNPVEMVQLAKYISNKFKEERNGTLQVYSKVYCSLNHRPYQTLLNPSVNLVEIDEWDFSDPKGYILPLAPLPEKDKEKYPWNWSNEYIEELLQFNLVSEENQVIQ